jgi:CheY-like chemotaxis protein
MGRKILVVDDEPDMLTVSVCRLETAGYEVLKAANGKEAIEVMEKDIPDLILLDLLLPDMQGDAFCRKVRSDARFKKIPIILFTASVIRVPAKVREIGADDYILKPFEPEDLLFKIKKYIG